MNHAYPEQDALKKLTITEEERIKLLARLAIRKSPADEKIRMQIVLAYVGGECGVTITERLHTTIYTGRGFEAY